MRLALLLMVVSALAVSPASARIPPEEILETVEIEDGKQRLSVHRVRIRTTQLGVSYDFNGIRLGKLANLAGGSKLDLSASPIWRLDLRRLVDIDPFDPNPSSFASWFPIPDLSPLNNLPFDFGHPAAWVDHLVNPEAEFELVKDHRTQMTLKWRNLPVDRWYPHTYGWLDVTVVLGLEEGREGIQGSIDVQLRSDWAGRVDMMVNSVSFPELLLDPLNIGLESVGDTEDDILLSPFGHGYLVPNPIDWLADQNGHSWGPDSMFVDFAPELQGAAIARDFTYPGNCSSQFLFYYDPINVTPPEDWMFIQGGSITGYGPRPSVRGSGAGIYVAAHDGDVNVKRIIHEPMDAGLGNQMRLGIRTYVEFATDRIEELKSIGVKMPGALWQRYRQGPGVDTEEFDKTDGTVTGRDVSFPWPVVVQLIEGDWLDAVDRYRTFFAEESQAIQRDEFGDPVNLRDLPAAQLPAPYRELIGTIDLLDVTNANPPAAGQIVNITRAYDVRRYINWLRKNWSDYVSTADSTGPPFFMVRHREGMVSDDLQSLGESVESGGTDGHDRAMRPALPEFLRRIRVRDPRWQPVAWDGRTLIGASREHGYVDINSPLITAPFVAMRRETGHEGLVTNELWLASYARTVMQGSLARRVEASLLGARFRDTILKTYLPQLDLVELTGPGAAATPDWSHWVPELKEAHGTQRGVGGGNDWFEGHREARRAILEDPVVMTPGPFLFLGTEEFNEAVLQRNMPSGRRLPYPAATIDIDDRDPRHLFMYAESVPVTTFLYHDFSLMRGQPFTFGQYFAMPPEIDAGAGIDPRYFDQTSPIERDVASRLSLQRLTRQVVHEGLVPGVGVALSPFLTFEVDVGGDGQLASPDDRSCHSDGLTAGPVDLAKGGWSAGSPPHFARDLLRARSQMRRFFIGGRRVRDPELVDVAEDFDWFAGDLFVKRWSSPDFSDNFSTFNGGSDTANGGMLIERLVVGTYIQDGPLTDGRRIRAMICVANPSVSQVNYQLEFSPLDWGLPASEVYDLVGLDLKLDPIVNSGVTTNITPLSNAISLPNQQTGTDPFINGRSIQFWVLVRK